MNLSKQKKKQKAEEGQSTDGASDPKEEGKEERVIILRPLNMEDMRQAKNQVTSREFFPHYMITLVPWGTALNHG